MTEDEEFEALEQRLNMKEQEYEQINNPNGVTTWKTKPKPKEQAMNREDIIRMAREAGLHLPYWDDEQDPKKDTPRWTMVSPLPPLLERFAALVAAAEREACAKVVEDVDPSPNPIINMTNRLAAAAIRARGASNE